jgi:hypothetical protein
LITVAGAGAEACVAPPSPGISAPVMDARTLVPDDGVAVSDDGATGDAGAGPFGVAASGAGFPAELCRPEDFVAAWVGPGASGCAAGAPEAVPVD